MAGPVHVHVVHRPIRSKPFPIGIEIETTQSEAAEVILVSLRHLYIFGRSQLDVVRYRSD